MPEREITFKKPVSTIVLSLGDGYRDGQRCQDGYGELALHSMHETSDSIIAKAVQAHRPTLLEMHDALVCVAIKNLFSFSSTHLA